jgi:hypothetical protein
MSPELRYTAWPICSTPDGALTHRRDSTMLLGTLLGWRGVGLRGATAYLGRPLLDGDAGV